MADATKWPDFRKISKLQFFGLSSGAQWEMLLIVRDMIGQAIADAKIAVADLSKNETSNFGNVSKEEWDQLSEQIRWQLFADARLALKQIYGGATTMEIA